MTDFDYKQYSLENLENWLHDSISSAEATPQEIYDTIKKVVQEEYYYHKDKASKTNELLVLLNGHRSVSFINDNNSVGSWTREEVLRQRDYYGSNNSVIDFTNLGATDTITFTSCDANDTSPDCKRSWNSFWNDDKIVATPPYVSEDGDVWGKDKVTKWVLPVEVDGLTGDCVVNLPNDLLERVGWVEGDTVEFVSNPNGSFTVKKVVKPEVENI